MPGEPPALRPRRLCTARDRLFVRVSDLHRYELKRPSIPQLPSSGSEDRLLEKESLMRPLHGLSRSIVAVLLALAIVVGPQLCCCSFGSLAASPVATETAAKGCCCCCEQPTDGASSCPEDGGQNGGNSCPCRGKPRAVATIAGGIVPGWQLDVESWTGGQGMRLTAWMPLTHHSSAPNTSVRPRGVEDVPVIGGRALLRALSILRC